MKRRTRLRKLGLPADPSPVSRRPKPNYYDLAVAASRALSTTSLPNSWASNIDFLDDCHSFGVEKTVECLYRTGRIPSRWQGQAYQWR